MNYIAGVECRECGTELIPENMHCGTKGICAHCDNLRHRVNKDTTQPEKPQGRGAGGLRSQSDLIPQPKRFVQTTILPSSTMDDDTKKNHKTCSTALFLDPDEYRMGVFDIETSGLDAAFDLCLTCSIKEFGPQGSMYTFSIDLDEQNLKKAEAYLLEEIFDTIDEFDGVAGFYSSRFDMPFLRSRAICQGISPIPKTKHLDMWFTVKRIICSKTRRLERVNDMIKMGGHSIDTPDKTRVAIEHWSNVVLNRDKNALEYIMDHNIKDVLITENTIYELRDFLPDRIMRS